ncbi:MAG: hypothetical protein CMI81_03235 [Candidatus Pelagibacter sp.]|nr:hypothetical protein [Candidatus Pelagibacter sp.]OUV97069.1 MAG: hypothetical protein CBD02_04050 [Candidatus Pelagibacter sp. TMED142]|tara:strand:+ start:112 stop:516 length:405 start_codon:yes stop_codon:yes gene_type:complete
MILTCECGSRFEIPSSKIPKKGITVKCSVCGKEWFQQFIDDKNENKSFDTIDPSKMKNKISLKTKYKSNFFGNFFIFILFIAFLVFMMIFFKEHILISFPKLDNFYLTLEIMSEIIFVNIRYFMEIIASVFKNI